MGESPKHIELSNRIVTQPHILEMIIKSSLLVSEELRKEYVTLVDLLGNQIRSIVTQEVEGKYFRKVPSIKWEDLKGEAVCFIDGGVGEIDAFLKKPMLIRGGIFKVVAGESDLSKRESFCTFPVLIGDVERGLKRSDDFSSVLRIIVELMSALKVCIDPFYEDIKLLMLHGPIMYHISAYSAHYFGAADIAKIWNCAQRITHATQTEFDPVLMFRESCKNCQIRKEWCEEYEKEDLIRAVCFMKFLLTTIQNKSKGRFDIMGVVERSFLTEYIRTILLPQCLERNPAVASKILGASLEQDPLKNAEKIVEETGYYDALLLSIAMDEGEFTVPVRTQEKYSGFSGPLEGFGEVLENEVPIKYSYLKVRHNTLPMRIEIFDWTPDERVEQLIGRTYLYSRLLPNYAFPIGLDIVDKYVKVPDWMMEAFRYLIMIKFGESLSTYEVIDLVKKMLGQAFIFQRDFYYRPGA